MFVCARCGEPVTVPYRYNGSVYGYSCIDIVNPGGKKVKDSFVAVEFVSHKEKVLETGVFHTFKVCSGFAGFVKLSFWDSDKDSFALHDGKLYLPKSYVKKYRLHVSK